MARTNIKYTTEHKVYANEFIEVASGYMTTDLPFTADTTYRIKAASIAEDGEEIMYNKSSGAYSCNEIIEPLPDGYTELEYIQSSGTQYIKTEIVAPGSYQGMTTEIKFEFSSLSGGSSYDALYGVNSNMQLAINNSDNKFTDGSATGSLVLSLDTPYHYLADYNNGKSYIDGELIRTRSFSSSNKIYLFAIDDYGTANNYGRGKIYYCKILINGTYVRILIPAKRNSDNEVGMYDRCTGQFFTNQGTGTFTAGPIF